MTHSATPSDSRSTPASAPARLREIVARRNATIVPGTPNALFARVIEDLGYEAVYVTGAGIANMHLGAPDIGLVTVTEVAEIVSAISDSVSLPIIVDADTGFGNPVNMVRTVRLLERAGAAGIQIEDQVFPKKCGHFQGKDVIPLREMVQKVKAAVDTRRDPALQIIARTDARAIDGLDAAIERAHAFVEAGADVIFVEAPTEVAELRRIAAQVDAPHVVNIVFGGLTPEVPREALAEMGFSIVLYANAALQAALKSVREVLGALKDQGSLSGVRDRLASFTERQAAVEKARFDALERRYTQPE
jgi:2-methylisocitrate lyase-like PEP mutase family enzyme